VDLTSEIRQLDRRIAKAAADIQTAVTASGTTLTELCGSGALNADKILGRVGPSFDSIPPPHSPPAPVPPRSTCPPEMLYATDSPAPATANSTSAYMSWHSPDSTGHPGRAYYLRKRTEGTRHKEAMRCLKRRLSDVVYRQLRRDANRLEAGPGGHSGAAPSSSAAS
jgi:transposase